MQLIIPQKHTKVYNRDNSEQIQLIFDYPRNKTYNLFAANKTII